MGVPASDARGQAQGREASQIWAGCRGDSQGNEGKRGDNPGHSRRNGGQHRDNPKVIADVAIIVFDTWQSGSNSTTAPDERQKKRPPDAGAGSLSSVFFLFVCVVKELDKTTDKTSNKANTDNNGHQNANNCKHGLTSLRTSCLFIGGRFFFCAFNSTSWEDFPFLRFLQL